MWYSYTYYLNYNGYQEPLILSFSKCTLVNPLGEKSIKCKSFTCDSLKENSILKIVVIPWKVTKKSVFIAGNLKVFNYRIEDLTIHYPFFDDLQNEKSIAYFENNSLTKIDRSPYLINGSDLYSSLGKINGENISIQSKSDSLTLKSGLFKVFQAILINYPFYKQRHLDKDYILNRFNSFIKLNYTELKDSLKILVGLFEDPHFFILTGNNSEKMFPVEPVKIYPLNNDYVILAIFDTSLTKLISLGDHVLEINNIPIKYLIDSLSNQYRGTKESRILKATANLLRFKAGDKILIKLLHNLKDTMQVTINYKINNKIPPNFIPKHCRYIEKDNISYIKINVFDQSAFYCFINNSHRVNKTKRLIIDLRNNPGGDLNIASKIIAMFINEPLPVFNTMVPYYDMKETSVLYPDKISKIRTRIIILIDKGTVCAGEYFAYMLKKYCGAILIGDNSTAGSFSTRYHITFEDGFSIYTNAVYSTTFYPNEIIESLGIDPDIWVWKSKVEDFYPYKDKVLTTAYRYLLQ
jgi:C-terminal processing protease CtpA/Prc